MAKILISISSTDTWATLMFNIARSTVKSANLKSFQSQDGQLFPSKVGKALEKAFNSAGYDPYEQVDGLVVIESKDDSSLGITIDYREEIVGDRGSCIVQFFNDQ